jgi:glyoxylase-like metal-dependent hydrolase (beta-lactamase superfamily II)
MTAVRLIRAPNPGPYTLEGTNTWIVGEDPALVIDPGPDHEPHLARVAEAAGPVAAILLTHRHPDHAPGAARLAGLIEAPVRAFDPEPGESSLVDGEVVAAGAASLRVLHTPGHTPDHVVFVDESTRSLFTGDAVLGRGTSVVDPPEGNLVLYLRSLRLMLARGPGRLYPGHGPEVEDGPGKIREYLAHREQRERQVLRGLAGGRRTPAELVPSIYSAYPAELHPVAARSVLAHLIKLEGEGRVRRVAAGEDHFELVSHSSSPPDRPATE